MNTPILQMRGITKTFPGVKALQDVTLDVNRGEVHAICGENGAGKSTLMKVLSGVYPHNSFDGDILFENEPCDFSSISRQREARHRHHPPGAGTEPVPVHRRKHLSSATNWPRTAGWTGARPTWKPPNCWPGWASSENPVTPIQHISVGKQQLVEIAKALSKEVKLLILDEPTAALNDEDSGHLLDLILHLKGQGVTSIIISHKLNEIRKIADAVTIIRDGKTIETLRLDEGEITQERIIRGMVGRDLDSLYPDRDPKIGEEVLRIEDWTVQHPQDHTRVVVHNASLNVRKGEVVGLAGLMGAGRTELAMSVFGRTYGRAISGQVFKYGKEIDTSTVPAAIRHGIAYATEDRKHYGLNLIEDIKRNVSMAALRKLVKRGWVDKNEETMVANGYRKSMNIKAPSVAAITGKLSGGNQQKVVLSKWMFSDPDVLILDEPTRGIDVGAKFEIYTIIAELAAEGKAVIVISSELPELLGICDRIYTLSAGHITGEVPIAEASQETLMHYMTKEKE